MGKQSLKRLDEIVKSLEKGDVSLADSMSLFEEGTALIKSCGAMLDEAEQKEVVDYNIQTGIKSKKYTSRIAYIGSLLYKKKYNGSMNDYYSWLASFDASVFNDKEVIAQIWEKITKDQKIPDSAKNA